MDSQTTAGLNFEFRELFLKGSYCIDYFSAGDSRGEFSKCFEKEIYRKHGIPFEVSESFFTVSSKNVVRGLHFQKHAPQAKLVSVVSGRTWDVIVDLRPDSETYKKWCGIELSKDNHHAVDIPRGFAHGFAALEDKTVRLYQCDGPYDKKTDGGIRLDDPELNIEWPVDLKKMIISKRDLQLEDFGTYERSPMEL